MKSSDKRPYAWPTKREWLIMSPAERIALAEELVAQADRQRNEMFEGPETIAQEMARKLLEDAKEGRDVFR